MANEIEIFGKRVRIVRNKKDAMDCEPCALRDNCIEFGVFPCEDTNGKCNRHFERVNPTDENV